MIESFPGLSCYGRLQVLQLQSNPIVGELPRDLWLSLPLISNLAVSNTMLNGQFGS